MKEKQKKEEDRNNVRFNFKFRAGFWSLKKKDGHQMLGNFKGLQIVLEGESVSC